MRCSLPARFPASKLFSLLLAAGFLAASGWSGPLSAQPGLPRGQTPGVRVSLDAGASRVAMGEVFQLQARVQVTAGDLEDFKVNLPLDGFEVIGRSVSRPMSFSFGFSSRGGAARTSSVEQVELYQLRALKEGTFTLGPAEARVSGKAHRSRSLDIQVKGGTAPGGTGPAGTGPRGTPPAGSAADDTLDATHDETRPPPEVDVFTFDERAFLRMTLSKAEPFVGEQVELSVYLYVGQPLQGSPSFEREPKVGDFWVEDLSQTSGRLREGSEVIQGRRFRVYELRRMALFPLKPGKASVVGPRLKLDGRSLFDRLQGNARAQKLGVKDASVVARPLPPEAREPALVGETSLEAALSTPSIGVGETATWTFTIVTQGNAPLLRFEPELDEGLRALTPAVNTERNPTAEGLELTHTLSYTLVAESPGTFTLPALEVSVVDPSAGSVKQVRTSTQRLRVTGVAPEPPPSTGQSETRGAPSQDDATAAAEAELSWRAYLDRAAEEGPGRVQAGEGDAPPQAGTSEGCHWFADLNERSTLGLVPWLLGPTLLVGVLWVWLSIAFSARRRPRGRAQRALARFRQLDPPDIRAWQQLFSSLLQVWPRPTADADGAVADADPPAARQDAHGATEPAPASSGVLPGQVSPPRLVEREPASLSALDLAAARAQLPPAVHAALATLYGAIAQGTYGAPRASEPGGAHSGKPSGELSGDMTSAINDIAAALAKGSQRRAKGTRSARVSTLIVVASLTLASFASLAVTEQTYCQPPVLTAGTREAALEAARGEAPPTPSKRSADVAEEGKGRHDAATASLPAAPASGRSRDVRAQHHMERARAAGGLGDLLEARRHIEVAWRLAPHNQALGHARRTLSETLGTAPGEEGTLAPWVSRDVVTLTLLGAAWSLALTLGVLLALSIWRRGASLPRTASQAGRKSGRTLGQRACLGIVVTAAVLAALAVLVRVEQDTLADDLADLAMVTEECPVYAAAVGGSPSGSLMAGDIVVTQAPTGRRVPVARPGMAKRWLALDCVKPVL